MTHIVRWTLGPVSEIGLEILKESVARWKEIYGNSCECFICYNSSDQIHKLHDIGAHLIDQRKHAKSLPFEPFDTTWKFYPPRLCERSHELFIDNDLVIYKRSPSIDAFFSKKNSFVISSAHKSFYGQYKFLNKPEPPINSGVFGIPPYYDFKFYIECALKLYPKMKWETHSDDEGILAFLFSKKNTIIIPMSEIYICNPFVSFAPFKLGSSGTHFAGSNYGNQSYWDLYQEKSFTQGKNIIKFF